MASVSEAHALLFPLDSTPLAASAWLEQGFVFAGDDGSAETSPDLALRRLVFDQSADGPCGVLAAVHALFLRRLLFLGGSGEDGNKISDPAPVGVDADPGEAVDRDTLTALSGDDEAKRVALTGALADALWGARGPAGRVTVVIPEQGTVVGLEASDAFDVLTMDEWGDLVDTIERHIGSVFQAPGGLVAFVFSLLLTRGVETVREDMHACLAADLQGTTLGEMSYSGTGLFCGHSLVNLIVYGVALSHVMSDPDWMLSMTSQPPPPSTANIGMLTSECCVLWPSTPVWVVLSGGHYTTLFALDPAIAAPGALDELTAASDADLAFYHANGLSRIRWSAVPAAGGADPIDVQGARLASVGVFVDLQFASEDKVPESRIGDGDVVRVVDVVTEGSGTDSVFLFGVSVVKPKDEHTWDCLCGRAIDTAYNTCRVCGGWRCVCTIVNNTNRCGVCGSLHAPMVEPDGGGAGNSGSGSGNGPWTCLCTIQNTGGSCTVCGTSRAVAVAVTGDGSGDGNDGTQEEWQCGACTVINEAGSRMCAVCGADKPDGGGQGGGDAGGDDMTGPWECAECTTANAANHNSCLVCDAPRGGPKMYVTMAELPSVGGARKKARAHLPGILITIHALWPHASVHPGRSGGLPSMTS